MMRSKDDAAENGGTKSPEAAKTEVNAGVMLKPLTLQKLARSIEYHQAMAEANKDGNKDLAATHADAAAQLQALVAASPAMSALDRVLAKPRPMRRTTVRRTVH